MNVTGAIKGNTLGVNWSIQRFLEEIKIILADFFFFLVDFVFRKHLDTTLKWSTMISGENKMMNSYESNCTSLIVDYFIKLW